MQPDNDAGNLLTLTLRLFIFVLAAVFVLLTWTLFNTIVLFPEWLYWIGIFLIWGAFIWFGYSTGLFGAVYLNLRALVTPEPIAKSAEPSSTNYAQFAPVEVARIAYQLNDEEYQEEFDLFLDEPIYMMNDESEHLYSPGERVEKQALLLVAHFEEKYEGHASVEANIHRGSLIVVLTFFATAYTLASQYKDFYDSISFAREQLERTFSDFSDSYQTKTERRPQLKSDVDVKSRTRVAASNGAGQQTVPSQAPSSPVTVTNSFSPPGGGQPINVSITMPSRRRAGCVGWFILILIVLLLFGGVWLFALEPGLRKTTIDNGIQGLGDGIESIGLYLKNFGIDIQKYEYSGP